VDYPAEQRGSLSHESVDDCLLDVWDGSQRRGGRFGCKHLVVLCLFLLLTIGRKRSSPHIPFLIMPICSDSFN
jgi:hypothetical protein